MQDWATHCDNGPTGAWERPAAIKEEWVDQANEWTSPSSQWDSAHPTGWVSASSPHQWTSDESKGLDTSTKQWASDPNQWSSAESSEWGTATNQWASDPNQWSSAESKELDTATQKWYPGQFQAEPSANDFHSKEPMVKEELEGEDISSGAMGVAEMTGNAGVTVGQSQTPAGYRWWHGELIPLTPEEQKAVQETLSGVHEKRWKSGWQNRAVMLMALYNKERWLELDRAMKLFSQHHSTYLQTLCLESAIQKWGDAGPKKSGYPW